MTLGMYSCALLKKNAHPHRLGAIFPVYKASSIHCSKQGLFDIIIGFVLWNKVFHQEDMKRALWHLKYLHIGAQRPLQTAVVFLFTHFPILHQILLSSLLYLPVHSIVSHLVCWERKLKQTLGPLGNWQNNGPSQHIIRFVWVSVNGRHLLIARSVKPSVTGEVGGLTLMTTFNDPDELIDQKINQ